jgi:hypothetical protein
MRNSTEPLQSYLDAQGPFLARQSVTWPWNDSTLELEQNHHLVSAPPPAEFVTSVRAILVDAVLMSFEAALLLPLGDGQKMYLRAALQRLQEACEPSLLEVTTPLRAPLRLGQKL